MSWCWTSRIILYIYFFLCFWVNNVASKIYKHNSPLPCRSNSFGKCLLMFINFMHKFPSCRVSWFLTSGTIPFCPSSSEYGDSHNLTFSSFNLRLTTSTNSSRDSKRSAIFIYNSGNKQNGDTFKTDTFNKCCQESSCVPSQKTKHSIV